MGSFDETSKDVAKVKKSWVFGLGGAIVAAFGTGWLARDRLADAEIEHKLRETVYELKEREIELKESQSQLARVQEDSERQRKEVDQRDIALTSAYELIDDLRERFRFGEDIKRIADPVALVSAIERVRSDLRATNITHECRATAQDRAKATRSVTSRAA